MKPKLAGFTLLEVMITLVIAAILGGITVSGLSHLLQHGRDESERLSLIQILNHAHRQAEILHRPVTLCQSIDKHHCGGEWSDGLIAFINDAEDGVVPEESQVISVLQHTRRRGSLHVRFFPAFRTYMTFRPLVFSSQDNGTFWYCHAPARQPVWAVQVNRMGLVTSKLPDQQGEIRDGSGKVLTC